MIYSPEDADRDVEMVRYLRRQYADNKKNLVSMLETLNSSPIRNSEYSPYPMVNNNSTGYTLSPPEAVYSYSPVDEDVVMDDVWRSGGYGHTANPLDQNPYGAVVPTMTSPHRKVRTPARPLELEFDQIEIVDDVDYDCDSSPLTPQLPESAYQSHSVSSDDFTGDLQAARRLAFQHVAEIAPKRLARQRQRHPDRRRTPQISSPTPPQVPIVSLDPPPHSIGFSNRYENHMKRDIPDAGNYFVGDQFPVDVHFSGNRNKRPEELISNKSDDRLNSSPVVSKQSVDDIDQIRNISTPPQRNSADEYVMSPVVGDESSTERTPTVKADNPFVLEAIKRPSLSAIAIDNSKIETDIKQSRHDSPLAERPVEPSVIRSTQSRDSMPVLKAVSQSQSQSQSHPLSVSSRADDQTTSSTMQPCDDKTFKEDIPMVESPQSSSKREVISSGEMSFPKPIEIHQPPPSQEVVSPKTPPLTFDDDILFPSVGTSPANPPESIEALKQESFIRQDLPAISTDKVESQEGLKQESIPASNKDKTEVPEVLKQESTDKDGTEAPEGLKQESFIRPNLPAMSSDTDKAEAPEGLKQESFIRPNPPSINKDKVDAPEGKHESFIRPQSSLMTGEKSEPPSPKDGDGSDAVKRESLRPQPTATQDSIKQEGEKPTEITQPKESKKDSSSSSDKPSEEQQSSIVKPPIAPPESIQGSSIGESTTKTQSPVAGSSDKPKGTLAQQQWGSRRGSETAPLSLYQPNRRGSAPTRRQSVPSDQPLYFDKIITIVRSDRTDRAGMHFTEDLILHRVDNDSLGGKARATECLGMTLAYIDGTPVSTTSAEVSNLLTRVGGIKLLFVNTVLHLTHIAKPELCGVYHATRRTRKDPSTVKLKYKRLHSSSIIYYGDKQWKVSPSGNLRKNAMFSSHHLQGKWVHQNIEVRFAQVVRLTVNTTPDNGLGLTFRNGNVVSAVNGPLSSRHDLVGLSLLFADNVLVTHVVNVSTSRRVTLTSDIHPTQVIGHLPKKVSGDTENCCTVS